MISGSKKPCSLSGSMDLLTASVALPDARRAVRDGGAAGAAPTAGITGHPFWQSWALAGAESDEVRLTDVYVDEQLIMRTELGEAGELDELQTVGFIWFELLISAAYVGMVSALVERLYRSAAAARRTGRPDREAGDGEPAPRRRRPDGDGQGAATRRSPRPWWPATPCRTRLGETVNRAVELLGGMAFITSSDVAYLAAVSHGLTFHPPSRASFGEAPSCNTWRASRSAGLTTREEAP